MLARAQNTEFMLSKLRAELHISDDRHLQLRQCVVDGDEQPWLRCDPRCRTGTRILPAPFMAHPLAAMGACRPAALTLTWQGACLLEESLLLTIHSSLTSCSFWTDSESYGRARYRAHANGAAAGPYGDEEAAGYAPAGPQHQEGGGGGYPGVHPGGHPGSAPHAHQCTVQYNGSGGARGGSAEAKRPLEGQYPGGPAGGRCHPPITPCGTFS